MASCIIYHGPGARQAALNAAHSLGRLVAPPFGAGGLKVEEARDFVALMQTTPLGEGMGIVVAGPMDQANPKAADTLLKCIEEFDGEVMVPVLWAYDLGGVVPTIQSRCLDRWCPATGDEELDEELVGAAQDLIRAALAQEVWKLPPLLTKALKDKKEKGREILLLGEMAEALMAYLDRPAARGLWERLRSVTLYYNPTSIEILAALLPTSGEKT